MAKLVKAILISAGFLLVLALALLVTGNGKLLHDLIYSIGDAIEAIWLWIIGLLGFIIASFKKLGAIFGPSKSEKAIRSENERIKLEMENIRQGLRNLDDQLQRERSLHKREIALYEQKINEREKEIAIIRDKIRKMEELGPENFYQTLSDEDKKKYDENVYEVRGEL